MVMLFTCTTEHGDFAIVFDSFMFPVLKVRPYAM